VKGRDDRSDDRTKGPKPLASSAARRIEAIVEGAEAAAGRVIDDAEAKARAYLAEAEAEGDRLIAERLAALGELTDALVAQADAIRRQSELLAKFLEEARRRLEGEATGAPAPVRDPLHSPEEDAGDEEDAEPSVPHLTAVDLSNGEEIDVVEGENGEPAEQRRGAGTPAGARLLATQMAVSGSSREEIAIRLRNGFKIEDADAILDAILGPEG
jgi:hypothetical protein